MLPFFNVTLISASPAFRPITFIFLPSKYAFAILLLEDDTVLISPVVFGVIKI